LNRPCITLILPAYNEAARIAATIHESTAYLDAIGCSCEVIVAADGTDGTREIAGACAQSDPRIRVIGSPQRLGKGRAVREAVAVAGGSIIGYADADNKVPIQEISKLLPFFDSGAEIVVGSRGLPQSVIERHQPLYRRLGAKGFALAMRAVTGVTTVRDTQCGFKFFRHDAAKWIFARQTIDGYMFDVEILSHAIAAGFRIEEVPILWRDDGDSRLQLFSDNFRNMLDILRIGRSRLT
jgi:dolichyl-phosphate beta-glucosyltransferase